MACATGLATGLWRNSKPICTSTFVLKTISCFREQLPWNRRSSQLYDVVGLKMYIPKANEENRVSVMQALMVSQPLATLVTLGASGLFASHIPMIFEDDGSEFGLLKGHISAVTRSGMTSCQPWMRSPFSPAIKLHLAELVSG